jgi:hypothetical protein
LPVYVVHTQCDHCGRVRRIAKIAVGESTKCPQCGCSYVVKALPSDRVLRGESEGASPFAAWAEVIEGKGATAIVVEDESGLTPLPNTDSPPVEAKSASPSPDDATELLSPRTPISAADPLGETAEAMLRAAGAAPLDPLGKLGRFELRDVLGQGGFGVVYRAYDPFLEREVALKVPSETDRDSPRVKRFLREARSAARLKHPNIVAVFEAGETEGRFYIASEYVEGKPLSTRIAEQPPNREQAVAWVRDLALALAYAHDEGIVHRDIKPGNIIMSQHGRPQLTDFGLSKRLDLEGEGDEPGPAKRRTARGAAELTVDGDLMGTPAYMSPEQARGEHRNVGPSSDQYSLGVVLYELLTGQRPFVGTAIEVLDRVANHDPVAPRKVRPDIPVRLEQICLRAMARIPEKRYADCGELAVALQQWLKEAREIASKAPAAGNDDETPSSGASLAGLGMMATFAVAGALVGCGYNLLDRQLWAHGAAAEIAVGAVTSSIAPLVGLLFGGLLGLALHLRRE